MCWAKFVEPVSNRALKLAAAAREALRVPCLCSATAAAYGDR